MTFNDNFNKKAKYEINDFIMRKNGRTCISKNFKTSQALMSKLNELFTEFLNDDNCIWINQKEIEIEEERKQEDIQRTENINQNIMCGEKALSFENETLKIIENTQNEITAEATMSNDQIDEIKDEINIPNNISTEIKNTQSQVIKKTKTKNNSPHLKDHIDLTKNYFFISEFLPIFNNILVKCKEKFSPENIKFIHQTMLKKILNLHIDNKIMCESIISGFKVSFLNIFGINVQNSDMKNWQIENGFVFCFSIIIPELIPFLKLFAECFTMTNVSKIKDINFASDNETEIINVNFKRFVEEIPTLIENIIIVASKFYRHLSGINDNQIRFSVKLLEKIAFFGCENEQHMLKKSLVVLLSTFNNGECYRFYQHVVNNVFVIPRLYPSNKNPYKQFEHIYLPFLMSDLEFEDSFQSIKIDFNANLKIYTDKDMNRVEYKQILRIKKVLEDFILRTKEFSDFIQNLGQDKKSPRIHLIDGYKFVKMASKILFFKHKNANMVHNKFLECSSLFYIRSVLEQYYFFLFENMKKY